MLDLKFIRQNPQEVKIACQSKRVKINIDEFLRIDKKRLEVLRALEDMRAQKNKASKEIGKVKNEKEKSKIILKMKELDSNSDRLTQDLNKLDVRISALILKLPNLPQKDVPVGKDERDNVVLREVGERKKFDFQPKDYLEIAESLDWIDVKRAAKTSGSRFGFLKNEAVTIQFALINLAFDNLVKEGFVPVIPPVMLKEEMAKGTGYFEAADKREAYFLPKDKLFFIGTSEQSLLAMHANEVFDEKELPKRYLAFSTCFRREAGSYGKDTKGILRVHQFDKLEMFSLCRPEDSQKEHFFLLQLQEKLMQQLALPYRVVKLCSGDLSRPSALTYDIETWIPSENKYRETHSTSNCTDFQARRLSIKYRDDETKKLDFVHTLNGTAFAIGRTLIALIENYQQKDNKVLIPDVLKKYFSFK